ncbi:transmembrane amino acid transporter protein-domain-containing protein [Zychaea mexicana]|uniref:transmembrane amino acid transporter protein-domain-containing protein n=1 Tax=Zychaea mexicana TaxID=64656 RepID=UPI0022FEF4CC|nr:transmembrane amino acid transporter protein-domain-containing protein [Zychaea mexicana]KAI9488623.1 transmembrane amino acid transporter protein-domain-containing protein [Zychaea mexicana]
MEKKVEYSSSDRNSTLSIDTEKGRFGNAFDCDRSNAGSSVHAYWNIVCCVCGTGMLGLSQALSKGGWGAVALLLVAWWMAIYCSIVLIKSLYHPRKQQTRLPTLTAVAQDAFGKIGACVCFFFQTWIVLGTPVLYLVLCGSNMNELCRGTVAEIGQIPWTIVFSAFVAIPYIFFKSMKDMGWTSLVGSVAILVTSVICVVVAAIDRPNVTGVTHHNIIWEGYPAALSTIAFSLGGNVVYPSVEASMKKPQHWNRVVAGGVSTCAMLYIFIAIPGYYVYGDSVQNPIYYSIPGGVPRIIAIVLMTVNVTVSAPIFLMSFTLECESMLNITVERWGRVREFIFRAAFRALTIVFCCVIGCVVPYFDLLMALFGAFGYCTTIFIIPIVCYWRLTGFKSKPIYELAWNFLILLFGVVGLVFGSWFAIEDLIAAFKNDA